MIIWLMLASELLAVWLIYRLLASAVSTTEKTIAILVTQIPIVGPIFVLFVFYTPSPLDPSQRNEGPRGEYTHRWLSMRSLAKERIAEANNAIEGNDQNKNKNA
ncbi:hypothetical protein [Aurantivibrio plasticivorans]